METKTQEVMRHRVSRIGSHRSAHRRPIEPPTRTLPVTRCPEPTIQHDSPLPHALWIVGSWIVALVAGVALGVGLAHHLAG